MGHNGFEFRHKFTHIFLTELESAILFSTGQRETDKHIFRDNANGGAWLESEEELPEFASFLLNHPSLLRSSLKLPANRQHEVLRERSDELPGVCLSGFASEEGSVANSVDKLLASAVLH